MSKPKRKLFGTSENLLKGEIALSNFSHSSGIKGVLTVKILGGGTADLSVVPCGAAEGTHMSPLRQEVWVQPSVPFQAKQYRFPDRLALVPLGSCFVRWHGTPFE